MLTKVYPSEIDGDLKRSPEFENCGIRIRLEVRSQIRSPINVLWRINYPMTQTIAWCCHD